ncbi:putative athila retroelement ORF1 protein [Trifolium medium]|uniref:Putative athila retroelement ORF1 protein n=1 Tax=Trifolium medium TaxID=97028 RepID=A0A392MRG7_9FABA|nr:putative athila retroelement ORF1 protein [Trifolium medium]
MQILKHMYSGYFDFITSFVAFQQQLEDGNSFVEETPNNTMEEEQTMRDYCRRTDRDQVTLGFQPANPVTIDIKGNVLTGLRENQFDGRLNTDPWDHLSQFAETCEIQKVPETVMEDQKKLRLFSYKSC